MRLPHSIQTDPQAPNADGAENPLDFRHQLRSRLEAVRDRAIQTQARYNAQRAEPDEQKSSHFKVGDAVMMYIAERREGNQRKLQARWVGPYLITEMIRGVTARLKILGKSSGSRNEFTRHVSKLKHFKSLGEPTRDELDDQVLTISLRKRAKKIVQQMTACSRLKYFAAGRKPQTEYTTPPALAKYIGEMINPGNNLDLCAGDGAITNHIDGRVTCLEVDADRLAKIKPKKARRIRGDMMDERVVEHLLTLGKFDNVVSNPPFHLAFEALVLAQHLLRRNGKAIFLLPTEFFTSTLTRRKLYANLRGLSIHTQICVGRWDYYGCGKKRATSDAVYILQAPDASRNTDKFSWTTKSVDLQAHSQ